jgi:L-lactate permease
MMNIAWHAFLFLAKIKAGIVSNAVIEIPQMSGMSKVIKLMAKQTTQDRRLQLIFLPVCIKTFIYVRVGI